MQRQRLQLAPMPLPPFPPLPGTGVAAGLPPGYGLGIYSLGGWLGHKGAVSGYNADMFYLPSKNATIIVLVNARDPQFLASKGEDVGDAAAISIAQIVLPGAPDHPGPKIAPGPSARTVPTGPDPHYQPGNRTDRGR
jgi:CubicO group peptidase (beta-lactamase class C family)